MKASTSMSWQATRIVTEAFPPPVSLWQCPPLFPPLRDQVEGIPLGIFISWYSHLKHCVLREIQKLRYRHLFIYFVMIIKFYILLYLLGMVSLFINVIYSFCGSLSVYLFAWSKRVHLLQLRVQLV